MKCDLPLGPTRFSRVMILVPGLIVLLWSLIQLVRDPRFFWTDDFQVCFSPIYEEIVRAWHDGEWPILTRNSWCSYDLAGEFQFGTFSPPFNAVLLLIWSFPLSLPLKAAAVAIIHLMWMATGVYVLGRERGLSNPLGTMAALAATLNGWMIGWAASDWPIYLVGASWVPWTWWALQTARTSDSLWKQWLRPGLLVALLITSGNTFAIMTLPVIAGWLALEAMFRVKKWRSLGQIIWAGALGTGLSAPSWWLLFGAATRSTRWGWGNTLQHAWVVPWRAWPGLVLPSMVTPWPYYDSVLYPHANLELACGLAAMAALAAALLFHPRETLSQLRWELLLLVACVVLVSIPSVGQFRWSFRWLPLFHLVLALTGAAALQAGYARRAPACGVALVAMTWLGTALFGAIRSPVLAGWLLGLAILWWLGQRFLSSSAVDWMPAGVVAFSLAATFWLLPTHEKGFQAKFSFGENLLQPEPLDPHRLYLGLYSFDEISDAESRSPDSGTILRPGDAMQYAGLRFINGYSPYTGRDVQGLFEIHGNVELTRAQSLAGPDGERLLLFLGVDGIVFSQEYLRFAEGLGPEWQKVAETSEGVVYHREPRRFAPVKVLTFLFDRPEVTLLQPALRLIAEKRNSVTVQVTAEPVPASEDLGVLAPISAVAPIAFVRPYLPGYRAFFNGQPVPVRAYRDILPLVELPPKASGTLELRYRPPGLVYGLALTGASGLIMLLIGLIGWKRRANLRNS